MSRDRKWDEVGTVRTYPKFKECEPGDVLVEGIYNKEFIGRYGVQYEFKADNGTFVVLNGSGQLRYKMEFVRPGDYVKIVYDGSTKLDSGNFKGQDCHQFKLFKMSDLNEESEVTPSQNTREPNILESLDDMLGDL
jgi:hypothetical protein